jgi:hypothetical protein
VISQRHQIAVLEKEVARLRQDCARQQALVRASQRTIGLTASPPAAAKSPAKANGKVAGGTAQRSTGNATAGKRKRKRRPVARALKAVAALQAAPEVQETPADSSSAEKAEVVQRSVASSSLATAEAAHAVPAVSEA